MDDVFLVHIEHPLTDLADEALAGFLCQHEVFTDDSIKELPSVYAGWRVEEKRNNEK